MPFKKIFAFAGAEQPPCHRDLAGFERTLEFAPTDFQHDILRSIAVLRCDLRFVRARRRLAAIVGIFKSGTHFFGVAIDIFGARSAHGGLVPFLRKVVLNIDLRLSDVAVNLWIDKR